MTRTGTADTQRPRRLPQRTCIACRRTDSKRELVRLVRSTEGRVSIDPGGKLRGRGAYLCHDPACWKAALQRRSLQRALRLERVQPEDQAALEQFAKHLEDTAMPD